MVKDGEDYHIKNMMTMKMMNKYNLLKICEYYLNIITFIINIIEL